MKSIEREGVLVPLLLRNNLVGNGYEIISGHRIKEADLWAGEKDVPFVIRELNDEQAVIAMVDSNLHRENLKPSEKAFVYRMKLEAMKHQGKKKTVDDLTSAQVEPKLAEYDLDIMDNFKLRSNEILARQTGVTVGQIKGFS